MDACEAIQGTLKMGELIGMAYLSDLSDQELLQRPHEKCQHLNWQIGHLICSEHNLINSIAAGTMPELPNDFAEKYTQETAGSNQASSFASKDELLQVYHQQRQATLALLQGLSADQLDRPTGIEYAPTVGALIRMQGEHWLMHCGQWVIVRRQAGKPVVI
jgi:hypothetical protein